MTTLAALLICIAASACHKNRDRSTTPAPAGSPTAEGRPIESGGQGTPQQQDTQQDSDLAILSVTAIDIDARLAALCGIPDTKVYFKYDSANLSAEARERLDQLATCATTGAAKGKELRLIGRTDPVGTDAYNQQLGMTRAGSVGEYLRNKGVSAQRVEIESQGEQGAPANPLRWPEARRVTIRLQDDAK